MIIPDVNVLVYAYNPNARHHDAARLWWEDVISGGRGVGLTWVVMLGFIRLTTSKSVMVNPITVTQACGAVREWLLQPNVTIVSPGASHAEALFSILAEMGTGGNLTTDAHLATLAMEFRGELVSNDADFARINGLRWARPF